MIVVIAKMKTKLGKRDEFIQSSQECIVASRKEAGNLGYDALINPDDPDDIVYVEQWESMEAVTVHMNTQHYLENQPRSAALREGTPDVRVYEANLLKM